MINFIFLMAALQHLRHANEGTYVMAFEAHLDSHQITSIQNWWEFFWILFLNMYLRTQNGGSWALTVLQRDGRVLFQRLLQNLCWRWIPYRTSSWAAGCKLISVTKTDQGKVTRIGTAEIWKATHQSCVPVPFKPDPNISILLIV